MKKLRIILPLLLVAVLIGGVLYLNPLLPIITGYAAKNLASGIFLGNRSQESLEATDLNFSFIKYVKNKVDYDNQVVESSFLWHKSRAVYIEGYGSILVNDYSIEEIKSRPYRPGPVWRHKQESIPWPAGDLIADTIPSGIDVDRLNTFLDSVFTGNLPYKGTFAVMVTYKGQPVAERYAEGFGPENRFLSWSMAKSITSALAGILVRAEIFDIYAPADIEEWKNDKRRSITPDQLMRMNSGLEWNEDYGNNSDVNKMLFKKGDMAAYAIAKELDYKPGTCFEYSSGSTNIVSLLMRKAIGDDAAYLSFPREALFEKIGMKSAIFEPDPSGTFIGSSYIYATMRDYTRFGLLYLNKGNWLGEQILPEGWVEYTTASSEGSGGVYGAGFWLNLAGKDYSDVPRDMFCCRGHDGQFIYIIPSKHLVIVRTGFSRKDEFDQNRFISGILETLDYF